jgi:hypothetical protein
MLEGTLTIKDSFAEVVANKDKIEKAISALSALKDDPAVGALVRHLALIIVISSYPKVLVISVKALY